MITVAFRGDDENALKFSLTQEVVGLWLAVHRVVHVVLKTL